MLLVQLPALQLGEMGILSGALTVCHTGCGAAKRHCYVKVEVVVQTRQGTVFRCCSSTILLQARQRMEPSASFSSEARGASATPAPAIREGCHCAEDCRDSLRAALFELLSLRRYRGRTLPGACWRPSSPSPLSLYFRRAKAMSVVRWQGLGQLTTRVAADANALQSG